MPLQQTSGAASYDAFGGGAPVAAKYIEDFFQTWLRTGTGSSTTVTTGLNASINKSLVWTKSRSAATNHKLTDTARGVTKALSSNTTGAEVTDSQGLTAFSSTGYTIGTNTDYNNSGATYVDWQWVATPKFFDVVTWSGNGVQTIQHNLGSVPGCIIWKRLGAAENWFVYHRSTSNLVLNSNAAADGNGYVDNLTSTSFRVYSTTTTAPDGYVGYVFAHNAGGFGLTGTDNVISCGSFTTDGSGNATIDLGYEPQWVLTKNTATGSWVINDVMRGMPSTPTSGEPPTSQVIYPNLSNAEASSIYFSTQPTPTGFKVENYANASFSGTPVTAIYIAIRRGPMKVPTTGTSVFAPVASDAAGGTALTTNFPVDLQMYGVRAGDAANITTSDRLRGVSTTSTAGGNFIVTSSTAAETGGSYTRQWGNTGFVMPAGIGSQDGIFWNFRRAPGFFDEVCYTGDATDPRTINHNLGVAPELIITKQRSATRSWPVRITALGNSVRAFLNLTDAASASASVFPVATYTGSTYVIGSDASVNASGSTYVAYLFASCPGVSKVGSYTGNGSSQTINMGFTGGARFFLVKRTDSTGDWWVYDSARGIVSAADPALRLNSTAAEVTSADAVDTDSTGLIVNQESTCNINVSSATYIYLGIS